MADRTSIERIAKILARANSDNVGEGETALLGAYARMNRDGVTFTDLLSLPERDLYQDALVRLAEHIVKEQGQLSPSQKRTLYAEYLKRIVEKFSPGSGGRGGESSKDQAQREREDAARAYEERRRQEEARRARSEPPPRQEQQKTEPPPRQEQQKTEPPPKEEQRAEKPNSRQNGYTAKDGIELPISFDPSRFPFSFSPGAFFSFLFGADSFIGCIYSFPKRALQLLLMSLLVGGITSAVIYYGLILVYGSLESSILASLWRVLFYETTRGFFLCVLISAYVFYERGWYPRGPRHGQTDAFSITRELSRLALAILWRVWGVVAWIGNQSFLLAYKWKCAQVEKGRENIKKAKPQERESEKAENHTPATTKQESTPVAEPTRGVWLLAVAVTFFFVFFATSILLYILIVANVFLLHLVGEHHAASMLNNSDKYMESIAWGIGIFSITMTMFAIIHFRRAELKRTR
mgnify:CR=1 FL=1